MMAAMNKILYLISIWLTLSEAQNTINRIVTAQCYKSSKDNILKTYFKSDLQGDDINFLYGLEQMAGSDPPMYTKSTDCAYTLSAGVLSVETTINMGDPAQSSNTCGYKEVYSTDNPPVLTGYSFHIALRKVADTYLFWQDRDYLWTCLIESATDTWLTTQLQVTAPGPVPLTPLQPTISFYVIKNDVDFKIDSCNVGDELKLQVKLEITGYHDHLSPWGLYSFDTMVNWESNFAAGSGADPLINEQGCHVSNNILALLSGFTLTSVNPTGINSADLRFVARTGTFRCRKYPGKNMLHFVTTVGTCFGVYSPAVQRDQNCVNFCLSNSRRKRETFSQGNYTHFVTSINVMDKIEDNKTPDTETDTDSTAVLIIAPIVGILSLIASVLGVIACCWANRRYTVRKRRLESPPPSEISAPTKY